VIFSIQMTASCSDQYKKEILAMRALLGDDILNMPLDVAGDFRLLRFLIDQDGDVGKATEAFKRFLKWRKDNEVDKLRAEAAKSTFEELPGFSKINNFLPVNLMLRDDVERPVLDKLKRPISVEMSGYCDVSGFLAEVSEAEMVRLHIAHLEKRSMILDELSRERDELVLMVLVKNFEGADVTYPIRHPQKVSEFMKLVEKLVTISKEFYPRTVGKAFIFRAPGVFGKIFNFFAPRMLRSHHLSLTAFVDVLPVDIFDMSLLPKELGGSVRVARLSHLPGRGQGRLGQAGERVEVGSGQRMQIPFMVGKGDKVEWRVAVEDNEIQLGLEFTGVDNHCATLRREVICGDSPSVAGIETFSESGKLILVFDNTASWFRSRTCFYATRITRLAANEVVPPSTLNHFLVAEI
jgi:hypothetical protein